VQGFDKLSPNGLWCKGHYAALFKREFGPEGRKAERPPAAGAAMLRA
jgi:hypothetical protein